MAFSRKSNARADHILDWIFWGPIDFFDVLGGYDTENMKEIEYRRKYRVFLFA